MKRKRDSTTALRNDLLMRLASPRPGLFRDALRIEFILDAQGIPCEAKEGSLRLICRRAIQRAGGAREMLVDAVKMIEKVRHQVRMASLKARLKDLGTEPDC